HGSDSCWPALMTQVSLLGPLTPPPDPLPEAERGKPTGSRLSDAPATPLPASGRGWGGVLIHLLTLALSVSLISGCGRAMAPEARAVAGSPPAPSSPVTAVPRFVDQAGPAGLRFVHNNGHHGPFYYPEMIGGGCAMLDVDGDGWLDLFLVNG